MVLGTVDKHNLPINRAAELDGMSNRKLELGITLDTKNSRHFNAVIAENRYIKDNYAM